MIALRTKTFLCVVVLLIFQLCCRCLVGGVFYARLDFVGNFFLKRYVQ